MSMYDTEPDSADPGRLREDEDRDVSAFQTCDGCGVVLHWTDRGGRGPIRICSVGAFCSDRCANAGCLQHEAAMSRRSA